jgi:hypothetical protein
MVHHANSKTPEPLHTGRAGNSHFKRLLPLQDKRSDHLRHEQSGRRQAAHEVPLRERPLGILCPRPGKSPADGINRGSVQTNHRSRPPNELGKVLSTACTDYSSSSDSPAFFDDSGRHRRRAFAHVRCRRRFTAPCHSRTAERESSRRHSEALARRTCSQRSLRVQSDTTPATTQHATFAAVSVGDAHCSRDGPTFRRRWRRARFCDATAQHAR